MELMMTSIVKAKENEENEKERRIKELKKIYDDTIAYCNILGDKLENLANKGQKPETSFYLDLYHSTVLTPTRNDYADGRLSYREGDKIDLDILIEWFSKFCFSVEKNKISYWRYWSGCNSGLKITIFPTPNCF